MYTHPRQMPQKAAVAANYGLDLNECFRCKSDSFFTERAHVIDRCRFDDEVPVEVVDGLSNIVPLCPPCHRGQPSFQPGEEAAAWAWVSGDLETYVRETVYRMIGEERRLQMSLHEIGVDEILEVSERAVKAIVEQKRTEMIWSIAA